MGHREFAMTLLRGQHLTRTATSAGTVLAILISCACAGEPETRSEMTLETESHPKATMPTLPEPPIPAGPLISDARCEKICDVWKCEERRRRPKPTKTLGDPPTPERMEKLVNITPPDHPDRPDFLFSLAEVSFEKSQYHSHLSCEQQKQCATLGGQGAPPLEQNACWSKAAKDFNRSQHYLTKAFEAYLQVLEFPDFSNRDEVLFRASRVHNELGYHDRARLLRKELLEAFPNSPYALILMRDGGGQGTSTMVR